MDAEEDTVLVDDAEGKGELDAVARNDGDTMGVMVGEPLNEIAGEAEARGLGDIAADKDPSVEGDA